MLLFTYHQHSQLSTLFTNAFYFHIWNTWDSWRLLLMVHAVCMLQWKELCQWGERVPILALATASCVSSPGLMLLIIEIKGMASAWSGFSLFSHIFSLFEYLSRHFYTHLEENLMVPILRRPTLRAGHLPGWHCRPRHSAPPSTLHSTPLTPVTASTVSSLLP